MVRSVEAEAEKLARRIEQKAADKVFLKVLGLSMLAMLCVGVISMIAVSSNTQVDPSKMRSACADQYPGDREGAQRCTLDLLMRNQAVLERLEEADRHSKDDAAAFAASH